MPKQEQVMALTNIDKETALAISYQAFKDLNWDMLFAGGEKILGQTKKKWNTNAQHVVCWVNGSELTVSSEMIKNELFDIGGRNKKNITAFFAAFEVAKNNITADTIAANSVAVNELRSATVIAAAQEQKEAEELDEAMNLPGSNKYVTYGIIALNVLVFILMAVNGAGIFEPESTGIVHIKWGANYAPLTLSGDWWRLVTNVFVHFGIIHLAMNMYCLYMVGIYLEPMLGKIKYTTAYLCTGILASMVSLWWHKEPVISAGASGAIFGMYGLFLALLTSNLIPKKVRQALLQSIVIFVAYNLLFGLKKGVDNSAHVGGLVSGFVIGYIYIYAIKKEKQGQKLAWIAPAVIVLTLGILFGYLEQNKFTAEERTAVLSELQDAGFKDNDKYMDKLHEFSTLETKALIVFNTTDSSMSRTEYVEILKQALPIWDSAESIIQSTKSYTVSEVSHKKAAKLLEYIQLRKNQYNFLSALNMLSQAEEDETIKKNLEETENKLSNVLKELKEL